MVPEKRHSVWPLVSTWICIPEIEIYPHLHTKLKACEWILKLAQGNQVTVLPKTVHWSILLPGILILYDFFCLPGDLKSAYQYLYLLFHHGGLDGVPSAPALRVWLQGGRSGALESVTDMISCVSHHLLHFVSSVGPENHFAEHILLAFSECNNTRPNVKTGVFLVKQAETFSFYSSLTFTAAVSPSPYVFLKTQ